MTINVASPEPKANMGQPIARVDGRSKVTGGALYSSDQSVPNPLFAFLVTSSIARGTIAAIDQSAARATPGVVDILTRESIAGLVHEVKFFAAGGIAATTILPMQTDKIEYAGEIVAVVLAETYEAAREASYAVKTTYREEAPSASFGSAGIQLQEAKEAKATFENPEVGDFARAYAAAPVTVDAHYETPTQHHNPIELFTTTCVWNGPDLTVYEGSQFVWGLRNGVAQALGIESEKVRVVSPFIGGSFGSRGSMTPRTAIIALAARKHGRPVKLVATRGQGFTIATFRAETQHHIKLGADASGKFLALSHEGTELSSRADPYFTGGTDASTRMYACANIASKVTIAHADRSTPGFMRAPAEIPYMFALESAVDELAHKLGMDPIELRRINDTQKEPIKGLPYTSRSLMACFDQAAAKFGWAQRNMQPGMMRDGDWLVGQGCATACYPSHIAPAAARARLTADGQVRLELAASEIGNGSYTVAATIAAERLGVTIDNIVVAMGDTNFPPVTVAGGSNNAASISAVVGKACDAIRAKLGNPNSGDVMAAMQRAKLGAIEEYAEFVPGDGAPETMGGLYKGLVKMNGGTTEKNRICFSFGAHFVEVRVNALTHEVRAPRLVSAFASGRIINPRTARSQYMGGMIWGVGAALHEATEIDDRAARYVNDNIAEYLMAVNADIQQLDVIMTPEEDATVNEVGVKGIGELGVVGMNAAVANAVFNATGQRVRTLPIRIESLMT